jgi:SNF2 family DNA or RNA helicase
VHAEVSTDGVGDLIVLDVEWNETALVKLVPGVRWSSPLKRWTLRLTWPSCVALLGVAGRQLTAGPRLIAWYENEQRTRIDPITQVRNLIEWPEHWNQVEFDSRLYSYQRVGVYMALLAGDGMVFGDEMAGGKGVQSLCALRMLHKLGQPALPALIVCPNSVKRHWAREVERWFPEATAHVVAGSQVKRRKIIEDAKLDPTAIVIVNIEAIRKLSRLERFGDIKLARCLECSRRGDVNVTPARCEVHPRALNDFNFVHVTLDEAHRIKDPKSQQTRAFWALANEKSVVRRWGLTGTVLANHVGDLWSIMHGVVPREYPVRSTWVDRYALVSWNTHGGVEIVGLRPDTRDEFFRFFDSRYRRVTMALVQPQIPQTIRKRRDVDMSASQRRVYTELHDELVTYTEDGELFLAPSDLVATTRLMQAAAGTLEVTKPDRDDVSTWIVKIREPSSKIDELMRVHDELDGARYVVCAVHRDVIDMAAKRYAKLGVRCGLATGGQTELERDDALQRLVRGEIQVLLTTVQASKEGLDFSIVDTMVFLQRSWSIVDTLQIEARHSPARRTGDDRYRPARIVDIVTAGTVEETQLVRLLEKLEMLEEVNRDRVALARAGRDTSQLDQRYGQIAASSLGTR